MKASLICTAAMAFAAAASAQNTGIGTITPTDQLHTTGTVRFQNYSGTGTRPAFLDSTGRIVAPATTTLFSSTAVIAIADNGCNAGSGAVSGITVSGLPVSIASSKIAVRVNITHTYDGDLIIYLLSPSGALLNLSHNLGSSGHNYTATIFSDEATTGITAGTAPFTGRYLPHGYNVATCTQTPTVSTFTGIDGGATNPNGTWRLKVYDAAAQDVGTLDSWDISFDGLAGFGGAAGITGPVPYFRNGAFAPSNIFALPNGNTGIGTALPAATLEVDGSLRLRTGAPQAGQVLTSTNVSGDAAWQKPVQSGTGFVAGITSQQFITNTSTGTVQFADNANTYSFDDGSSFDNVAHGYVAPAAGVYQFNISIDLNGGVASGYGSIGLRPLLNGVNYKLPEQQLNVVPGGTLPATMNLSFMTKLALGDAVTAELNNQSSVTISALAGATTHFSGHRVY